MFLDNNDTPMMRQYHKAKQKAPGCLLLFRLGDFFEFFFEDAKEVSKVLGITLTNRKGIPMCGVPHRVVERYIKKLLDNGKKVAICEQVKKNVEDVQTIHGRGLLDREVIEIITPGTISNSLYLSEKEHNYVMCVHEYNKRLYTAWIDISIGEMFVNDKYLSTHSLLLLAGRISPKEILIKTKDLRSPWYIRFLEQYADVVTTECDEWVFSISEGKRILLENTQVLNLRGFGIVEENEMLLAPVGALLHYVNNNQPTLTSCITSLQICSDENTLEIDANVIHSLELFVTMRENNESHSLFGTLDKCSTAMGSRLLRSSIVAPSRDKNLLEYRYDVVSFFIKDVVTAQKIEVFLDAMYDMARLLTRFAKSNIHAKDVYTVGLSIDFACKIYTLLQKEIDIRLFKKLFGTCDIRPLQECAMLIKNALCENPPTQFGNDSVIKETYDADLDSLRDISNNEQNILDKYLAKEQSQTTHTLRLRYNNAAGYYFNFSHKVRDTLPPHFHLRQILKNAERYKTDELIEIESKIIHAKESLLQHEIALFEELCKNVYKHKAAIHDITQKIAQVDMFLSFAKIARQNNYVRPEFVDEAIIEIDSGRHCVIENILPQGEFIPNDISLGKDISMMMITGPNMAGKSTFLRQNALIVIMAHLGSFVPAKSVRLGVFDKIFCRVGASDNMAKGESTFLMEMSETAYILHNATHQSLVIMDEIGRGTSVVDGMAIAQSVAEFLLSKRVCTLFATHYHDLTSIKSNGIKNYAMGVELDAQGNLVFVYKIEEGIATNSYGIEVAKLAGIPQDVIQRAYECLKMKYAHKMADSPAHISKNKQKSTEEKQGSVFDFVDNDDVKNIQRITSQNTQYQKIKQQLMGKKIENITPLESLQLLDNVLTLLE